MNIKAIILSLILAGSLQACSFMDVFDLFKPSSGLSVDTEIVAGDKEETIATEVVGNKETTHNTADQITQTYNTVVEGASWYEYVILLLALMAPTPTTMFKWFTGLFRRNTNGR